MVSGSAFFIFINLSAIDERNFAALLGSNEADGKG